MAESNFTTPEQKNAADRSSGSASEKLEPSLNTLQGETAQTQAEPTIPVREEASAAPKGFGAVLRAAREAEGISVGDMAALPWRWGSSRTVHPRGKRFSMNRRKTAP